MIMDERIWAVNIEVGSRNIPIIVMQGTTKNISCNPTPIIQAHRKSPGASSIRFITLK